MASVALHPLASRTGNQTSTIVSVDVSPERTPTLSSSAPQVPTSHHHNDDDLFGSSPTARAFSPNAFSMCDWSSNVQANGSEWGLHHDDLDNANPIITTGRTASPSDLAFPVRAMNAEQFAKLHQQYVELDVPHSVLFPFLHGVDGDNPAQCAFFHAPLTGQPTPHYRGLTVVRADMPSQGFQQRRERASSSASKLSMYSSHRSRTDSLVSSSNFSISSTSSEEDEEDNEKDEGDDCCHIVADQQGRLHNICTRPSDGKGDEHGGLGPGSQGASGVTASRSASSGSSSASESRASSLFSLAESDTTMATQSEGDAYKASEAAALHARESRQKRAAAHSSSQRRRQSQVYVEPQPMHSLLVSTVLPDEIINPPLIASTIANGVDVAQQCQTIEDERCIVKGATFARPRQAEGISLRNFKTQCAKYATISDVVVYCPAGFHEGALNLAKWVAEAQETCYAQRMQRGLGGLRYNVFLVTDSFDAFERHFPHLVSVDGSGFCRQRVDFIDREREEMQRFTSASEIDENVFMGCSANVPIDVDEIEGSSSLSLDSYLPLEVNPHAFSICIETTEHNEMPTPSRLSHASHYLDAFEATTLFELNSQDALRNLHEDVQDEGEESVRPSLGPTGWSPSQTKRGNGSSNGKTNSNKEESSTHATPNQDVDAQQLLCPAPNNLVHLRALGSGSCFEDDEAEEEAIESIVQLCIWMHKQAKPRANGKSSPVALAQQHQTHTGFSSWRSSRAESWPKHQQQLPRRILLHCSDGYTDSSILGLAYLMYARNLTLPQAYLDLQNRCARCFFVYARDVPFLQRLEKRMIAEQRHMRISADRQRSSWTMTCEDRIPRRLGSLGVNRRDMGEHGRHALDNVNLAGRGDVEHQSAADRSVWARSLAAATGLVTGVQMHSTSNTHATRRNSMDFARTATPTPRRSTPTPQSPQREMHARMQDIDDSWFHHPQFQGSFPSRILPFLYLGNLSHAMNPAMLHALGITHVVSVGESALIPPSTEDSLLNAAAASSAAGAKHAGKTSLSGKLSASPTRKRRSLHEHKTLWEEERVGRISVLDLKNVSDDGIDSLRPHMNRAIEYIEEARLQGGKVLVHCRVGVSRSATVCIAYVMAHCDLSMIESFLLVRSRRMNVLTQPTLLFVWELRGVEAHLIKLKRQRREQHEHLLQAVHCQRQAINRSHSVPAAHGGEDSEMHDVDDGFSLAALSISSAEASHDDNNTLRARGSSAFSADYLAPRTSSLLPLSEPESSAAINGLPSDDLLARRCIFSDEDLRVDIGAGAGSVYGFDVPDCAEREFNAGSLTRLDYRAARLTHGCFCKLLSELNARYMVA